MASNSGKTSSGSGSSSGLDRVVAQVVGQVNSANADAANQVASMTAQLDQLRTISQLQADALSRNTEAVMNNTIAQATSSAGSALSTAGGIVSKIFGSGMGLSPLITGLVSLFGGGSSSSTPPPLVSYTPPQSISLDGQVTQGTAGVAWTASQGQRSGTPAAAGAPQITVQVNAMDSKSFMDHSQDIARAVRAAMLNSNSLNDVVNDL